MTVTLAALALFGVFLLLLFIGTPISIAIAVSSITTALMFLPWDQATFIIMQKMNGGLDSFTLLAVPLFILAGNIMNAGGIADRLIRLAQLLAGRIPGSLAQTNVVANMFFGALSGSAVAAAAAIGGTMHPQQKRQGYDPAWTTAVNIASAPTGLLIPPTTAFIVYSMIAGGVSISALFMAGVVPGILMGISTMVVAAVQARRMQLQTAEQRGAAWKIILDAVPSLLLVVVVIGGIVGGAFTATEGAGVAVLYTFVLSLVYRSMSWRRFVAIMATTTVTAGVVLLLIAASSAMSWIMAYTGIPEALTEAMLSTTSSPIVILLLMNLVLLLVGAFMDITPAILIFTPVLLPIATELGMDPVQFGVVLVLNMCIGTMTPPVGSVLFVGSGISGVSIEKVFPKLWPHLLALMILLLVVTYVPNLSLGLPSLLGLLD